MKDLHAVSGVSKQSLYKYRKSKEKVLAQEELVCQAMEEMREEHKKMSSRKVYHVKKDALDIRIGRDKFEQIAFSYGYRVKQKRNVVKTTWGQRVEVYPDLVSGLKINNINQVFQSDIFYLEVEGEHYYGVTIEDIYSRRLVSLHVSQSMRAEENIKALKKVLKVRKKVDLIDCIFHSDRGTQYISTAQKKLLEELKMKKSMCDIAQKNAYVERVQGTLKHEYFYENKLTKKNIQSVSRKIMRLYNEERPHLSLGKRTPIEFEQYIKNMKEEDRPILEVYQWK
jgi:transposase InsO family protein